MHFHKPKAYELLEKVLFFFRILDEDIHIGDDATESKTDRAQRFFYEEFKRL